jgi:hypothetical protein
MFFKALDPILAPFRAIRNKWVGAKSKVSHVKVDAQRVKGLGGQVQSGVGGAMKQGQAFAGQGQAAAQGAQGAMQPPPGMPGMPPGMPGAPPGAPGAPPGAGGPINPNPPLVSRGFWPFAKKFCSQCEAQMDKLWFQCPHCAQAAAAQAAAAAAAAAKPAPKTMAFMLNQGGGPAQQGGMQVIGWLVPLQGPQRGELFTLGSATLIGTDPSACNLVLQDKFMSSKHAEIKVEAGLWMLKDLGSTNGTYVNDKRVDKQELVDNDFVKFGQALCRFKSL